MHTKDFLAQELRKAGLNEMAVRAEAGYYHDYLSPLDTLCIQLAEDLKSASVGNNPEALKLLARHLNGEFDASNEEGDEWVDSPEGKAAFAELLRRPSPGRER